MTYRCAICTPVFNCVRVHHLPSVGPAGTFSVADVVCESSSRFVQIVLQPDSWAYPLSQAANLFERTVKGLTKALGRSDAGTVFSPVAGPKARDAAQRALLALITSLDAWAGPLKVAFPTCHARRPL